MARILVTGANGQLGNEMRVIAQRNLQHEFLFTDVSELDICNCIEVQEFMSSHRPDFIVNCAAYTAVTKAESDFEKSLAINRDALKNLAL